MVKFTTHRGKVTSTSTKQHRFLHARGFDHTHVDGTRKREVFTEAERRKLEIKARSLGFEDSGVRRMERTR